MARASWNGRVLAERDEYKLVEGNVYFPMDAVRAEFLQPSDTTSLSASKGQAHSYDLFVDGEANRDAAWYYPAPKEAAAHIRNHIAFWRGVRIER